MLIRRVFRTLLWTLTACTGFVAAAPAGDRLEIDLDQLAPVAAGLDERPVNFFVDIASTRLAEEVETDKRRIDLAGVPVVIGAARQNGAAPSVAAGIAGKHDLQLAEHVSLKTSGLLSRTHMIDTGLLSSARAGGEATLQFADGGTRLQLSPSLYAGMQDDVLHHVDTGFSAQLRQEIGGGLEMTAAAGRAWHDATLLDTEDRETTFGRLGLHFDILDDGELELAYQVNSRDGPSASQFRLTHGVVLLAHLLASGGWRFTGRYAFSGIERGYDDGDPGARRHDTRHVLNLESDWDLGSSTGADWHMKADYGFEQSTTDGRAGGPALHSALVSFTLNF